MEFLQSLLHNVMEHSQILVPKLLNESSQKYCAHKDEWSKKRSPASVRPKKKVQFEATPLLQSDEKEGGDGGRANWEKPGVQVKIVMTKAEAERMLSKCKNGGVLEYADVAREMVRLPSDRIRFMSK